MESNEYIVNYQNWDEKGNRYAVFADLKNTPLEITIVQVKCSKNDQFCKKLAKDIYKVVIDNLNSKQRYDYHILDKKVYHPAIYIIPIQKGDCANYTLNEYCKKHFYRLQTKDILESTIGKIISIRPKPKLGGHLLELKVLVKK